MRRAWMAGVRSGAEGEIQWSTLGEEVHIGSIQQVSIQSRLPDSPGGWDGWTTEDRTGMYSVLANRSPRP